MIDHCQSHPKVRWMYDVIVALAASGFRIEELAALRRSDIDLDAHAIVLTDERGSNLRRKLGIARTTKGRRTRVIPLNPHLATVIKALPNHSDGRLLHGPRGGRLRSKTVLDVLKRDVITPLIGKFPTPEGEIGFKHGVVHSFRHYFVSEAFRQGATESEIMEWVGHRDSKMVARYRHLRRDDCRQRMEQLRFFDLAGDGAGGSPEHQ
jgi:integrase